MGKGKDKERDVVGAAFRVLTLSEAAAALEAGKARAEERSGIRSGWPRAMPTTGRMSRRLGRPRPRPVVSLSRVDRWVRGFLNFLTFLPEREGVPALFAVKFFSDTQRLRPISFSNELNRSIRFRFSWNATHSFAS